MPRYLEKHNVDLAAELSNTVDDPFVRDRLLTTVAETCASIDDDEYALQLVDAIEDPGVQMQGKGTRWPCSLRHGVIWREGKERRRNLEPSRQCACGHRRKKHSDGSFPEALATLAR